MRVYSYIVKNDTGFSPNPFHGFCTLACCKPKIRKAARVGDLIIGMSPRGENLVYAMKVTRAIGFEDYWSDPQYMVKRPIWDSTRGIDRTGDNIYEPAAIGEFLQLPSFHSNLDGSENVKKKVKDLCGDHVLVATCFTYFGHDGPVMPPELGFLAIRRGHRCRFKPEHVAAADGWFDALPRGILGRPKLWPANDATWQQT